MVRQKHRGHRHTASGGHEAVSLSPAGQVHRVAPDPAKGVDDGGGASTPESLLLRHRLRMEGDTMRNALPKAKRSTVVRLALNPPWWSPRG